jgi:hypothetical protein
MRDPNAIGASRFFQGWNLEGRKRDFPALQTWILSLWKHEKSTKLPNDAVIGHPSPGLEIRAKPLYSSDTYKIKVAIW